MQIWFCKVSGHLTCKQVCRRDWRNPFTGCVSISRGQGTREEMKNGYSQRTHRLEELAQWVRTWVIQVHPPHCRAVPGVYSIPRGFHQLLIFLPSFHTIFHDLLKDDLRFTRIWKLFLSFLEAKLTYMHMKEGIYLHIFKIHHWQCTRSCTTSAKVTPWYLNWRPDVPLLYT